MNLLIDQFKQIVEAHSSSGLDVSLNFNPDSNSWFVGASVGKCNFLLSSQRKPVREFKSVDTASLYILEEIGVSEFKVCWTQK